MALLISLAEAKKYISEYIDENGKCRCKSLIDKDKNHYLCVLELTDHTYCNEERANIVNAHTAQYRGSEYLVKKIVSLSDPDTEVKSVIHITNRDKSKTLYEVNKVVAAKNYDKDPNVICGGGISYFPSPDLAYYYEKKFIAINSKYTGPWEEYYPNGQQVVKFDMVGGLIDGEYPMYTVKGKISVITRYKMGIIDPAFGWYDPDDKVVNNNSKYKSKGDNIDINKFVKGKPKCCNN